MNNPEDIVWNTITDSAKSRFDYHEFASELADFGEGRIAENILFMTIIGHAKKCPPEDIASDISDQLQLMGLGIDHAELLEFVINRSEDLLLEIKATEQALALYEIGLQSPGILVQVRSILKSRSRNSEA